MTTITNWKAKRSGAAITITGKDDVGADVRLSNVASIDAVTLDGDADLDVPARTIIVATIDGADGISHVTLA